MSKRTKAKRKRTQPARHGAGVATTSKALTAPRSSTDIALRVLTAFGLLLTAYLTWVAVRDTGAAFCTEGSGCDVVQNSRWSRFLGVPIALWGGALYALLAWATWRPAPRLTRWRRLWRLSFLGLAISVYLTLAGWIALAAFCAWCLLSLATLLAIFVLVHVARPDSAPGTQWSTWCLGNGLLALAVVAALHVSSSGLLDRRGGPRLHALAAHLEESGAKFYGAHWCPTCTQQKRKFSGAAAQLPYVECAPNGPNGGMVSECAIAGVTGYPTWVIGGRHYVQVIEPEQLAAMTGFDWEGARGD